MRTKSCLKRAALLLPCPLLGLNANIAHATGLETRDTLLAPVSFPPDQNWDGIDGSWSTFTLRVGTPFQYVRTYLSWQSYQTLVVIPEGCAGATSPSDCASARGGVFKYNTSTTWDDVGIYYTYIEQNFGITASAKYGFDTVGLAGNGENGPTLKNTTIGGVAVNDWYLGVFGINPKPTNFTSFNDPSPSYMTQLKDQRLIPSLSFGYTAGAPYRFAGVYGSLTLGGYDSSKYVANNITFNFGQDNDHQIIVGLQSITTPNRQASNNVPVQLLPNPVYIEIDTTLAQIWLPLEACQVFESEFGLTYDNSTQLYLLNNTQHESLLSRNANITFTIGQTTSGGSTLQIVLPYAAFDQTVKPPYPNVNSNSRYFPLRRAANSTQYLLGRTFMQEAYVIVDYEVSRFQLGQTVWNINSRQTLVPIGAANFSSDPNLWTSSAYRPTSGSGGGTSPDSGTSGGLGAGAIAGIVVGAVALIALAILAFFLIRRRRRGRNAQAAKLSSQSDSGDEKRADGGDTTVFPKAELAGSTPGPFGLTHHDLDNKLHSPSYPPSSADGTAYSPGSPGWGGGTLTSSGHPANPHAFLSEAHSRAIYEMPGDMPNREKDGRQLSEKEALQHRERVYNGIDANVESPQQSSPGTDREEARERRTVAPEEVVNAHTGDALGRHRAFSFELTEDERQNLTDDSDKTLAHSETRSGEALTLSGNTRAGEEFTLGVHPRAAEESNTVNTRPGDESTFVANTGAGEGHAIPANSADRSPVSATTDDHHHSPASPRDGTHT